MFQALAGYDADGQEGARTGGDGQAAEAGRRRRVVPTRVRRGPEGRRHQDLALRVSARPQGETARPRAIPGRDAQGRATRARPGQEGAEPRARPDSGGRRAEPVGRGRAEEAFGKFAREWHEAQKARRKPVHAADVMESMERDLFSVIGALPVTDPRHRHRRTPAALRAEEGGGPRRDQDRPTASPARGARLQVRARRARGTRTRPST